MKLILNCTHKTEIIRVVLFEMGGRQLKILHFEYLIGDTFVDGTVEPMLTQRITAVNGNVFEKHIRMLIYVIQIFL